MTFPGYGVFLACVAFATGAVAQSAPPPAPNVFDIPQSGVEFQTGDTWRQANMTFRLFGVQSCIRGTAFTNAAGAREDCGEASLSYFAALVRDTKPRCTPIARTGAPPVIYAVCAAHVGPNTLDLGTIIVTQGFGFAATDATGRPVNFQYAVAEAEARKARRGLWAFADLPKPTQLLLKATQQPAP